MSITIDTALERRLRERAEAEEVSVAAYMERLVLADLALADLALTDAAAEEVEGLALDGLNSGDAIEISHVYWEETHRRLDESRGTIRT